MKAKEGLLIAHVVCPLTSKNNRACLCFLFCKIDHKTKYEEEHKITV